ncbi:transcriptional regulator GcvA [Dongia soli]|uniref:Transcriptional regulator GcvA n=1 Tax=Dongia soli TaxID=600628 RepID=A0ABU5EBS9_9PROT|nr:transcriptional regulator GcvA [Dongia soli]MDY0883327.1 transcriptional regulator GcvA [Dongia soli]
MAERLPSLPALRVFEAAGRLLSFTRAAMELNVTQAAVSHQIRSLEDQLGQPLFERTTRRLALTAAGERLLPAASAAFGTLERAIADLRRAKAQLSITTTPFFGARWLAPRLGRFAARHPEIEISVRHTTMMLDLGAERIDLAIRTGRGQWPGLEATLIAPLTMVPVAAPSYIEGLALRKFADMSRAILLHDETREEWAEWLSIAGLDPAWAQQGPVFDDEHVLIAAVISGQGVALVLRNLVEKEIAAGQLVPVFDLTIGEGWGYYLVHQFGMAKLAKVAAFRDFVLREAVAEK